MDTQSLKYNIQQSGPYRKNNPDMFVEECTCKISQRHRKLLRSRGAIMIIRTGHICMEKNHIPIKEQ